VVGKVVHSGTAATMLTPNILQVDWRLARELFAACCVKASAVQHCLSPCIL
jgi:hypothetical protein